MMIANNVIKDIRPLFLNYKSNNIQQESETIMSRFGKICLKSDPSRIQT